MHDLRKQIDQIFTIPVDNPTVWTRLVPIKCIGFVWRTCLGRIPSVLALARGGINISCIACVMCSGGIEDTDHLFVKCAYACEVLFGLWLGVALRINNLQRLLILLIFLQVGVIAPGRGKS